MKAGATVREAEYVSELGRWDEAERPADLRLRRYVHGYFGTSSSLERTVLERHLPAAEIPVVLNFGAAHTRQDAQAGETQRLDHAWVTGLQTRYHLSEATGERRFMVVRFTPLGAYRFLRLSMDALADRTVGLEQIDQGLTALVSDQVMAARGWAQRFDAMEQLIGSRVAGSKAPPGVEEAWDTLVRTGGQAPVGSLAGGCSHRHLIGQFRAGIGLSPKKAAMLIRFSRSVDAVTSRAPGSAGKPYLHELAPPGAGPVRGRWAEVAADCGYFDQSHFIHEFRAFAGATPSEFRKGIPAARP